MTSNIIIPPELVHLIIDTLANRNIRDSIAKQTLRHCLFVSRCFRDRARHHILSGIVLSNPSRQFFDRIRLLQELLNSGPDSLSRYVKTFTLLRHYTVTIEDINKDGILASVLSKLCAEGAVEGLRMDLTVSLSGVTPWEHIHPELQGSLYDLCHSPRLKAAQLHGFLGLPSTFFDGTSLDSICLTNTRSGPAIEDSWNKQSPATLRSFKTDLLFTTPVSWTSGSHGTSPFSLLQSLTVSVKTPSHFAAAREICKVAFSSLKYLKFSLRIATGPLDFDFSQMSSLRTLCLSLQPRLEVENLHRHIRLDPTSVCHLLHSPLPRTLQSIQIKFRGHYSWSTVEGSPVFHESGWSTLDHLLSLPRFTSVPLIHLGLTVLIPPKVEEQEQLLRLFVEGLRRLLPNSCATNQSNVLLEAANMVGLPVIRATQNCKFPDTITMSRTRF